ncbi:hypothetical protein Hanom_Chr00s001038g01672771 [Helianthus anomalus]
MNEKKKKKKVYRNGNDYCRDVRRSSVAPVVLECGEELCRNRFVG